VPAKSDEELRIKIPACYWRKTTDIQIVIKQLSYTNGIVMSDEMNGKQCIIF
jgi:hypothetical protein